MGKRVMQEGTADSLQLIRGTEEEQKADFIAKQMGCALNTCVHVWSCPRLRILCFSPLVLA